MRYRTFGTTDISLSEICFGAMRFTGDAGHVARPTAVGQADVEEQNRQGRRALEAALDAGVNCIHSSGDYGTRWMLGEVLARHPKRTEIHHVIKVTSPDYDDERFDPSVVREEVESSLKALHTERISIVQHLQRGPRVSKEAAYSVEGDEVRTAALPRVTEAFGEVVDELRSAGKVGTAITFPHTMGYARAVLATGTYSGMAHFLNLIETEALELLDDEQARGHGFLAVRPLLQGMLTDKRANRAELAADDLKRASNWDSRYALLARIRESLGEPTSWTSFALKFALAHPAVTSVVTSANNERQLDAMVAASDGQMLDAATVAEIKRLGDEVGLLSKTELFVENLIS